MYVIIMLCCLQDELTTMSVKHGYNNALAIQEEVFIITKLHLCNFLNTFRESLN